MKFYLTILFLIALVTPSFAAENEVAQSKPVQKAVQEVETSVDGLVSARDENIADDLALRIDALKKVIELSLAEAKDLQVRALLIEKEPKEMALWRESVLVKIEDAMRHFELLKKKGVAHLKDVQLVKSEAEELRVWREKNYAPALRAINDYSSLQKGREVITTAKERAQKISKDVAKLGRGARFTELQGRLTKANTSLANGDKNLKVGEEMFQTLYILPLKTSSTELIADITSSSLATLQALLPETTSTALAAATSSPNPKGEEIILPSIKDLVRSSFDEVKEAYQIFIEMSGLVRKSL